MFSQDSESLVVQVLRIAKIFIIPLLSTVVLLSNAQLVFSSLAPDFTLNDIDGNIFSLHDFRGKIVILDFFATWCGPCMEEMPHLKAVQSQFSQGLAIISISVAPSTDTVDKLKTFRSNYNITWIISRDTADVSNVYNVTAIPRIYIIDKDGYVGYEHLGLTEESVLQYEVNTLIPEYPFLFIPLLIILATIAAIFSRKTLMRNLCDRS